MIITLREEQETSIVILDVEGELEYYNDTEFKDTVTSLLQEGKTKLVVNLKEMQYIDSSGIGAFVTSLHDLKKAGGNMVFTNVAEGVQQVFEFTRLHTIFEMFDNEEAAIERLVTPA